MAEAPGDGHAAETGELSLRARVAAIGAPADAGRPHTLDGVGREGKHI